MLERARTFLLVSLLAVTFWLFAEAESLGQFSGLTSLRFSGGESAERLVRPADGFDGTLTIDLTGSKLAVSRAGLLLGEGLTLEAGMTGVPTAEGRQSVNLLQALQSHPLIRQTGAQLTSVRPQVVDVVVTELTTQSVAIEAALPGVEIVGAVRIFPEQATLRMPKAAWELNRESLRATARVAEADLRSLPSSGVARVEARLEAPEGVAVLPGFTMRERTCTLEFIVRSRVVKETIASVPVQVVLPPIEVGRWRVSVEPEDRFLEVQASGTPDRIEHLRTRQEAVIGVVALSSDDLAAGVPSRPIALMVLREGRLVPSQDLELTSAKIEARLRIERLPEATGPGAPR